MIYTPNFVYIVVETTGLDPEQDEIIRIVILGDYGKCYFDSYFYPRNKIEFLKVLIKEEANTEEEEKEMWNDVLDGNLEDYDSDWFSAIEHNGITPKMLMKAPLLSDKKERLLDILENKDVIAFRAQFTIDFLKELVIKVDTITDCMDEFVLYHNSENNDAFECWSEYCSLDDAINYIEPNFKFDPYDSLNKAEALKIVWNFLYKSNCTNICLSSIDEYFAESVKVTENNDELPVISIEYKNMKVESNFYFIDNSEMNNMNISGQNVSTNEAKFHQRIYSFLKKVFNLILKCLK